MTQIKEAVRQAPVDYPPELKAFIQREEGGFKDMLVSSLILMARGEGGIDSEAAELESEIAAAKRTRMREAELKRKLGI